MARPDPALVRRLLVADLDRLLPALGFEAPSARNSRAGRYTAPNVVRGDRKAGSFTVYLNGPKAGGWVDYVADDLKGDVIDLVGYAISGGSPRTVDRFRLAMDWACRWLGLEGDPAALDPQRMAAERAKALKAREKAEAAEAARLAEERRKKLGQWLACAPLEPGTIAWDYLTVARGVDCAGLAAAGRLSRALRASPETIYAFDPDTKAREVWPALIAQMVNSETGAFAGIHITFLAPDGSGKAPVDAPRKMKPSGIGGAIIPITKGAANRSVKDAAAAGDRETLILTEGIEDALSIAMAFPDARIWAAGSVARMGQVRLPASTETVIIAAHNDDSRQAIAQFGRTKDRIAAAAREIGATAKVWRARGAKDFNDLAMRAKGPA